MIPSVLIRMQRVHVRGAILCTRVVLVVADADVADVVVVLWPTD